MAWDICRNNVGALLGSPKKDTWNAIRQDLEVHTDVSCILCCQRYFLHIFIEILSPHFLAMAEFGPAVPDDAKYAPKLRQCDRHPDATRRRPHQDPPLRPRSHLQRGERLQRCENRQVILALKKQN